MFLYAFIWLIRVYWNRIALFPSKAARRNGLNIVHRKSSADIRGWRAATAPWANTALEKLPISSSSKVENSRRSGRGRFHRSACVGEQLGFELEQTRTNSNKLERDEKHDKKPMNYEEWSKSIELDQTLTPNFLWDSNSAKQNKREAFWTEWNKGNEVKKRHIQDDSDGSSPCRT